MNGYVSLRRAARSDADLLFEWANDPYVRAQSFSAAPISYETHCVWLERILASDDTQIWIYCIDGVPAGQIRCHLNDEMDVLISYSIGAAFRGQGHGKRMIAMIPDAAKERFPQANRLIALVKPENPRSKRVFAVNGFMEAYTCYMLPLDAGEP